MTKPGLAYRKTSWPSSSGFVSDISNTRGRFSSNSKTPRRKLIIRRVAELRDVRKCDETKTTEKTYGEINVTVLIFFVLAG